MRVKISVVDYLDGKTVIVKSATFPVDNNTQKNTEEWLLTFQQTKTHFIKNEYGELESYPQYKFSFFDN